MTAPFDLRAFEEWMLTVIRHPQGLESGFAETGGPFSIDTVLPSQRVSSLDRMRVYSNAYFWRLIDILRSDFPGVTRALDGHDYHVFHDYLAAHPSTTKRLAPLGRHLSTYLREQGPRLAHHAFLADLADLEYTRECVFDAPRSPVIAPEALTSLSPDDWEQVRLERVTASALVIHEHPVNAYLDAVVSDTPAVVVPEPAPSYTLLCRGPELRVHRRTLSLCQYVILSRLADGCTLAEALDAALDETGIDVDDLVPVLGGWFTDWTAMGLFSNVR